MAECSQISLLIGPFEDGELEPHEMQEVARHLAICSSCDRVLNDYSQLGRELRAVTPIPSLDGFAQGVLNRISALPLPLHQRIAARIREFLGELPGTLAMGTLAAAVALVTAVVVSPYARRRIANQAMPIASIESRTVAKLENPPVAADAATPVAAESTTVMESKAEQPPMSSVAAGDSQAIISRLESEIPSVAVWSEPQNDTTVIWLPEQQ